MELNTASNPSSAYSTRFQGAHWAEEFTKRNFTLVGAGGIGSYFAFMLARLNPNTFTIFDDDVIEPSNMSGQMYPKGFVGKTKSDACALNLSNYCAYSTVMALGRFTPSDNVNKITICGLDNMEARRIVFDRWCYTLETINDKSECLFVDGRLALEEMQVFAIRGNDTDNIRRYREEWLFSDEEAAPTVCSMKQTTFSACIIAGLMTNLVVNHVSNLTGKSWERLIPFFTYYNTQTQQFTQEL